MLTHRQRKYELIGTVGMAAIAMLCAPLAMAKKPSGADLPFSKDHLVYVDFDKPNDTDGIPMVSRSNWPLGITITIPYDSFWTGEGAERGGAFLGIDPHYIFFEKAYTGCWYLEDGTEIRPSIKWPCDYEYELIGGIGGEIKLVEPEPTRYIEVSADIDQKGFADRGSRGDLRRDIGTSTDGVIDAELIDDVESGWGIGIDDDLPGLFLYAEVGSGFVWDYNSVTDERNLARGENGSVGVRNLAGLSNSVTHSVSIANKIARSNEVEIHTLLKAPGGLLDPVVEVDANPSLDPGRGGIVGSKDEGFGFANDYFKWRVDGGPVEPMPEAEIIGSLGFLYGVECPSVADVATAYLMATHPVTFKAFVISGTAPSELFDKDGDGDYVDDAIEEGYSVLSNVAEVQVLVDLSFDANRLDAGFYKTRYKDLDDINSTGEEKDWGQPKREQCLGPNGATYIRRAPR